MLTCIRSSQAARGRLCKNQARAPTPQKPAVILYALYRLLFSLPKTPFRRTNDPITPSNLPKLRRILNTVMFLVWHHQGASLRMHHRSVCLPISSLWVPVIEGNPPLAVAVTSKDLHKPLDGLIEPLPRRVSLLLSCIQGTHAEPEGRLLMLPNALGRARATFRERDPGSASHTPIRTRNERSTLWER